MLTKKHLAPRILPFHHLLDWRGKLKVFCCCVCFIFNMSFERKKVGQNCARRGQLALQPYFQTSSQKIQVYSIHRKMQVMIFQFYNLFLSSKLISLMQSLRWAHTVNSCNLNSKDFCCILWSDIENKSIFGGVSRILILNICIGR